MALISLDQYGDSFVFEIDYPEGNFDSIQLYLGNEVAPFRMYLWLDDPRNYPNPVSIESRPIVFNCTLASPPRLLQLPNIFRQKLYIYKFGSVQPTVSLAIWNSKA